MAMRLQELHPALVHFPIALLPLTLAADAIGRSTGKRPLLDAARVGIGATAVSAALAGVAGLLAQESSRFDPRSREMLVTHRTLNVGLVGLTTWMANRRARSDMPSLGYLAAGLVGLTTMIYSAYLGGRMVYGHGVGVQAAGGTIPEETPELTPGQTRELVRTARRHVASGVRDVAGTTARGEFVPSLRRREGREP